MKKYIDQEKAEKIISEVINRNGTEGEILTEIHYLPIADVVEVRHGRWKLHEDGSGTCQECGCLQKYVWDVNGWQNYCGHCGADMRNGGQDE